MGKQPSKQRTQRTPRLNQPTSQPGKKRKRKEKKRKEKKRKRKGKTEAD
jgi:hypothetical protein